MKVSVVTTMYRSGPYLEEFHTRCQAACAAHYDSLEFVFVNDGSPDDSLAIALRLRQSDPRIKVVDLSRNFGHHKAIMVGLQHAAGDEVFLIDCDLEESPEWLGKFKGELDLHPDADMVYGYQEDRKGGGWERFSGGLVWRVINSLSDVHIPPNLVTTRLMTRRFVQALTQFAEQELFLAAVVSATGFKQIGIQVTKGSKESTSYTLTKRMNLMFNGLIAFSSTPLMLVFYLGLLVSLGSFCLVTYFAVRQIVYGLAPSGWTSLLVSVWAVGGLIIFSVGVLGIYLSKIFSETKNRPYVVTRAVYPNE
jgi:putative glycosyltransferase